MADQQQNGDSKPLTDIELERLKMYQDTFKHMTTFSSGGILLASAVTGALFLDPKPVWVGLLATSIGMLAIGALAAMIGLLYVLMYMNLAADGRTGPSALRLRVALTVSVVVTYFGLVSFAYFATINILA